MSVRRDNTTSQLHELRQLWIRSITDTREALKHEKSWNNARILVENRNQLVQQKREQYVNYARTLKIPELATQLWLLMYDDKWQSLREEYSDQNSPEDGRNPRWVRYHLESG
jgi:hypothetical protein